MNFARILSLPLLAVIIIAGYRVFTMDLIYDSIYIAFAIVGLTLIYVFEPQVNWLFWKVFPPKMDKKLTRIIHKVWPEIVQLPTDIYQKALFRIIMYTRGKDYTLMGLGKFPEDIKAIFATIPIRMTLHMEGARYLMKPYERIIFYNGLFPSPADPVPHSCEINHEDGVLIFSMKHFLDACHQPDRHFSTGIYVFALAFMRKYPQLPYPSLDPEKDWIMLESVSGFIKNKIKAEHKIQEPDIVAFAMLCYWCFPQSLQNESKQLFDQINQLFSNKYAKLQSQN